MKYKMIFKLFIIAFSSIVCLTMFILSYEPRLSVGTPESGCVTIWWVRKCLPENKKAEFNNALNILRENYYNKIDWDTHIDGRTGRELILFVDSLEAVRLSNK